MSPMIIILSVKYDQVCTSSFMSSYMTTESLQLEWVVIPGTQALIPSSTSQPSLPHPELV